MGDQGIIQANNQDDIRKLEDRKVYLRWSVKRSKAKMITLRGIESLTGPRRDGFASLEWVAHEDEALLMGFELETFGSNKLVKYFSMCRRCKEVFWIKYKQNESQIQSHLPLCGRTPSNSKNSHIELGDLKNKLQKRMDDKFTDALLNGTSQTDSDENHNREDTSADSLNLDAAW